MIEPKKIGNKLLAVEGVRGIACLMVVFSHICLTFFPYMVSTGEKYWTGYGEINGYSLQAFIFNSPFTFILSGQSAVFIFFVLSGYILTEVANKPEYKIERIASMGLKRYPRLMIPALSSVIFVYFLIDNTNVSNPLVSNWINEFGEFDKSLLTAIYSGAIDAFFVNGKSNYNWVLWTMQIELIGSFLIFALCINTSIIKIKSLPVLFIVLICTFLVFKVMGVMLSLGLISFIIGFYISRFGIPLSNNMALVMLVIGLYLAGASNHAESYNYIELILGGKMSVVLNFFSGLFIVYSIIFNKRFNNFFSNPIFVFLGKVSFSVYLIHLPIIAVLGVWLFSNIFELTQSYYISSIIASCICLIITYMASIFYYKYIDVTGMKISDFFAKIIINKKYKRV